MRTPALIALTILLGFGLSSLAAAAPQKSSGKPASQKAAAPADSQEEIRLPGVVHKRDNGGYVSLDVAGTNFVLKFYDKDKKRIAPDATRASVRWQPKQKPRQMTSVLTPSGDGMMLKGDKVVQPPFVFKAYVTLYAEGETILEYFTADYRDDGIPPEGR